MKMITAYEKWNFNTDDVPDMTLVEYLEHKGKYELANKVKSSRWYKLK